MAETVSFSQKSAGWMSFQTWTPDWMSKLNNSFFSIKDGNLYLHNDESNPIRNNFYGEQLSRLISTVINEANSEDKIFKTLTVEATSPWAADIKTNINESTIAADEFTQRESRWFAHTRRSESATDYHGNAVQGIGNIVSVLGLNVTVAFPTQLVSVGDVLVQLNGSAQEVIGTITNIDNLVITVDAIITAPAVGLYVFAKKDSRVEGGNLRGNIAEITLTNTDTDDSTLFAISSNIVKSYV